MPKIPLLPIHQGESGLGKTTLINTLFSTELSLAKNYSRRHHKQLDKLTEVEIIKAELEEKQFKVKLTVIDTPGFGDYVNNRDSWSPIVDFIDDQHEAYMIQEQQPQRSEKSDLRVHACLYFIRPTGHTYASVISLLSFTNPVLVSSPSTLRS
jgi:cell division control protein 12